MSKLFVAIPADIDIRNQVRDLRRNLSKKFDFFRFVELDQLHITLQFLGENISDSSIEKLAAAFEAEISFPPFEIDTVTKLNFGFPGQINPHLLFWEINRNENLEKLTDEIAKVIKTLNLDDVIRRKSRRTKIHHVTIARYKRKTSRRQAAEIKNYVEQFQVRKTKQNVSEIVLYRSDFTRNKLTYKRLAAVKALPIN